MSTHALGGAAGSGHAHRTTSPTPSPHPQTLAPGTHLPHLKPTPSSAIYTDPHFDYHLYYTSKDDVEAIANGPCTNYGFLSPEAWYKSLKPMPISCFPTGAFINTALAVSGMGTHLVNALSPEFTPPFKGFGQTFIFGGYDGKINFVEMMASQHWLTWAQKEGGERCYPIIGGPKEYAVRGYKPHRYCVQQPSSNTTRILFTDMLWFWQGCGEGPETIYAPDSYAPILQQALLENPNCTYPLKPKAVKAVAKVAKDYVAEGKDLPEDVKAALAEHMVRRVTTLKHVALESLQEAGKQNTNGKMPNLKEQVQATQSMLIAALG